MEKRGNQIGNQIASPGFWTTDVKSQTGWKKNGPQLDRLDWEPPKVRLVGLEKGQKSDLPEWEQTRNRFSCAPKIDWRELKKSKNRFCPKWEKVYNPSFNYGEFATIKRHAGLNSFTS